MEDLAEVIKGNGKKVDVSCRGSALLSTAV
jgi:hypothetical protein